MKPYYEDEWVTIYNADVRSFPGPGGVAACIVTSPPYNVGIEYADHFDAMPWSEYRDLADAACRLMHASLIPSGRAWVNIAPTVHLEQHHPAGGGSGQTLRPRHSLMRTWLNAIEESGLGVWDTVAWVSPGRSGGTAWGSWEQPSAPNLRGDWEAIIVGYKDVWGRPAPEGMESWRDKLGDWQNLTKNVWKVQPEQRTNHPAPFPPSLAERCIRLSSFPGEVVVDPFAGSGSTLVAAKQLGRRAIGVELSERYCEVAANRLAQGVLDFDTFSPEVVDVPATVLNGQRVLTVEPCKCGCGGIPIYDDSHGTGE